MDDNKNNEIKNPFLDLNTSDSNNENSIFNDTTNYSNEINNPINNQTNSNLNITQNNEIINSSLNENIQSNNINTNYNVQSITNNQNDLKLDNELKNKEKMDMLLGINTSNKLENNDKVNNNIHIKDNEEISNNNLGFILLVLDIISFVLVFIGSLYGLAGAVIGLICFIISLLSYKKKIQYIKISLFISMILVISYIVIFLFSNNSVNSYLYATKINIFKTNASDYIDTALKYNTKKNLLICKSNNSVSIPLNLLINEMDYKIEESPFDNKYDLTSSYVKIETLDDNCNELNYYIYITDGKYAIGKPNNPVQKKEFNNKSYELE